MERLGAYSLEICAEFEVRETLVFQRAHSVFVPILRGGSWRDFQGDINAKYIKATHEQFPTCCSRLGIIVTK